MLKKSTVLTLLAAVSLWILARLLFAAEKQEGLYIVPVYIFVIGLSRLRWALAAFPLLFLVWNPGLFQGHAPEAVTYSADGHNFVDCYLVYLLVGKRGCGGRPQIHLLSLCGERGVDWIAMDAARSQSQGGCLV